MTWFTGIVVYILIWWTALFAILPIGIRPDSEGDREAGGWRGAPRNPRLPFKLVLTTLAAAILWLVAYGLIESGWIDIRPVTAP